MSEMALPGVFKGSNTIYHSASSNGTSTPQQNGRHIVNGAPSSASSSLGNDSSSDCPPETEVTCSVATMPAIQPKQEVEDTDTAHTETAKEDVKEGQMFNFSQNFLPNMMVWIKCCSSYYIIVPIFNLTPILH